MSCILTIYLHINYIYHINLFYMLTIEHSNFFKLSLTLDTYICTYKDQQIIKYKIVKKKLKPNNLIG